MTRNVAAAAAVLGFALASGAKAASVADVLDARVAEHQRARVVQQQIDAALGRRLDPAEVLAAQQLADALARALAERDAEQARVDALSKTVTAREQSGAELVPLLDNMLDLLEASLAQALPVDLEHRRAAVATARARLSDAYASAADRLAAVLAIYEREQRLAASVDDRAGVVMLGEPERLMTLIRIGRVALYALSDDSAHCALFERATRAWRSLDKNQCARLAGWQRDDPLEVLSGLPVSSQPQDPASP